MERERPIPEINIRIDRQGEVLRLEGEINGNFVQLAITATSLPERLSDLQDLVSSINGKNPLKIIHFYGESVLISANAEFEIFDKPCPSTSRDHGSRSQYLGQTKNREVLIQAQPPVTHSSKHSHDGMEIYRHVSGELRVRSEEQELELSDNQPYLFIPVGMVHQIFNHASEPAISVIICSFSLHRYCD